MSKIMLLLGIVFLVLGGLLGGFILAQPGQAQIMALTPDVSAIFLVGGGLCLGLGAIVDALHFNAKLSNANQPSQPSVQHASHRHHQAEHSPAAVNTNRRASTDRQHYTAKPEHKSALATVGTTNVAAAAIATETVARPRVPQPEPSPDTSVAETISALEQAKNDIAQALGIDPPQHKPEPVSQVEAGKTLTVESDGAGGVTEKLKRTVKEADELGNISEETVITEAEYEAVGEEVELFVVEEKVIRGRPARVLSDGTVEAETDEGWMRFENLEHLDEYLEAMVPEA